LAEGLGFGRDRAFFRAAGLHLIGAINSVPEPLGRAPEPPLLDRSRLRILRNLVAQWGATGAWETFRQALMTTPNSNQGDASVPTPPFLSPAPTRVSYLLHQLRNIFDGLGTARTDILVCNIVLPFAAAVSLYENDPLLAEHARNLYTSYPGL